MREPWFRQRWFGRHPIHRYGWAVVLIYWLITLPLLAVAASFAGTNNTVAFGALIAIFVISMGCGAISISRTDNRRAASPDHNVR